MPPLRAGTRAQLSRGLAAATLVSLTFSVVGCTTEGKDADAPASETAIRLGYEEHRQLPGGGTVAVPAESIPDGATLEVATAGAPDLPPGLTPVAVPVDLRFDTGQQPQAPVQLTYPYDPAAVPAGVDPAEMYGISSFDEATGSWKPLPVTFDEKAGSFTAELTSFSWKWPWQVDWAGIGAAINQGFGELIGKRSKEAVCESHSPLPSWARAVTSNEPALPIRTCAEGDPKNPEIAVVQLVNNRPYGLVVTSPVGFAWAWRQESKHIASKFTVAGLSGILESNQYYVPAGARASFGFRDDGWTEAIVTAEPTEATLVAEVAARIVSSAVAANVAENVAGTFAGKCLAPLVTSIDPTEPDTVLTKDVVRSWLAGSAGCVQEAMSAAVAAGLLDRFSARRIDSAYRAAGRFGTYVTLYSTEWDTLDLIVDQLILGGTNTFSLFVNDPDILSAENLQAFAGTWTGPIDQEGSRPYNNITKLIVRSEPTEGPTISGAVSYPGLECSGSLRKFRLKDGSLLATEYIDHDPESTCVRVVRLRFTPRPDGALLYEVVAAGLRVTGILERA